MNTIQETKDFISASFPDGSITLSDSFFTGAGINSDISGQTLTLSDAVIDTANTTDVQITYTGSVSFLNTAFLNSQLILKQVNDAYELSMVLPVPMSWKFTDSFPNLPPSHASGLPQPEDSFINELDFKDASFSISSNDVSRELSIDFNGNFNFGSSSGPLIQVKSSYPNWVMGCGLAPESKIDLKAIFDYFGLSVSDIGITDLSVTDFNITVNTKEGRIKFNAGLSSNWVIPVGSQKLTISGLTFEYDNSADEPVTRAKGFFELNTVSIAVMAERTSDDSGWTFNGTTEDSINLTVLGAELATLFSAPVPADLPAIELKSLDVTYNTESSSFAFSGGTDLVRTISLGTKSYKMDTVLVKLSSEADPDSDEREYTGSLQAILKAGNYDLTVELELGATEQVKASWTSTDGTSVGVEDIINLLGISATLDIPEGMDLGLSQINFVYNNTASAFSLAGKSKNYGNAFITAGKDSTDSWGIVLGVDFPGASKLSSLPGIGAELRSLDFMTFTGSGILLSSGEFEDYTIPLLPPPDSGSETTSVTPAASGTTMTLSPGISVATIIDFNASDGKAMGQLKTILGKDQLALQLGVSSGDLKLSAALSDLSIPLPGGSSLKLTDTNLLIHVTDEIVIQLSGQMAFSVNGKNIDVTVTFAIEESEAIGTIMITSDSGSLPAPPGISGLHLQEFGMQMGISFEPPAYNLGLQGKFKVGEQMSTDEFAIVLEIIEEVPNIQFLSFYFESLDFGQIISIFTNAPEPDIIRQMQIIKTSDASFYYAERPVTLPDGTTAQPGFAFSADLDLLSFKAHGDFKIDASTGIHGTAELNPLDLGGVLQISGDGQGITRNYILKDGVKVPVKNNEINPDETLVIKQQVVAAGGPILSVSSGSSPYLHMNGQVSVLGIEKQELDLTIDSSGMSFSINSDVAGIDKFSMQCTLKDWDSFNGVATCSIGVKESIGPVSVMGVNCGSLNLDAQIQCSLNVIVSPSDFSLSVSGEFSFEGLQLSMPPLTLDAVSSSLADLPGLIASHIKEHADEIFKDIFNNASRWANLAGKGVITGAEETARVLKYGYNQTADQAAKIMQDMGMSAQEVASSMKNSFNMGSNEVAGVLKAAGYEAGEVGSAIKNSFGLVAFMGANEVAGALQTAGYEAAGIALTIKDSFGLVAYDAATIMKHIGYGVTVVAQSIQSSFNIAALEVFTVLSQAEYYPEEIAEGMKEAFGTSAQETAHAMATLYLDARSVARSLKNCYGMVTNDVAATLKSEGYKLGEIIEGVQGAFNSGAQEMLGALRVLGYTDDLIVNNMRAFAGTAAGDLALALKNTGSEINEIGRIIGSAYDQTAGEMAATLKGAGFAVHEVAGYLNATGQYTEDIARQALSGAGYAAEQVESGMNTVFSGRWFPF